MLACPSHSCTLDYGAVAPLLYQYRWFKSLRSAAGGFQCYTIVPSEPLTRRQIGLFSNNNLVCAGRGQRRCNLIGYGTVVDSKKESPLYTYCISRRNLRGGIQLRAR